jgi:hypothetical protein
MVKRALFILAVLGLLSFPALAAPPVEGDGGTVACGGNHNVDQRGNTAQATLWAIRNFNESASLRLSRIRVFFGGGGPFDSDIDAYPDEWASVLGVTGPPGTSVLVPHGTALLRSEALVPFILSQVGNPESYSGSLLQMKIEWEADEQIVPPHVVTVIPSFRKQNLVAKHAATCLTIDLH